MGCKSGKEGPTVGPGTRGLRCWSEVFDGALPNSTTNPETREPDSESDKGPSMTSERHGSGLCRFTKDIPALIGTEELVSSRSVSRSRACCDTPLVQ